MKNDDNYKEAFFKSLDSLAQSVILTTILSNEFKNQRVIKSTSNTTYKHISHQELGQGKTRKTVQIFSLDENGYLLLLDTIITEEDTP